MHNLSDACLPAWTCSEIKYHVWQVDVYSFSMIAYQLFELRPPFVGMDPVDAARKAALDEERPQLMRLATRMPTMQVHALNITDTPSCVLCILAQRSSLQDIPTSSYWPVFSFFTKE